MPTKGNVPDNTDVGPEELTRAAALFTVGAAAVGPAPSDPTAFRAWVNRVTTTGFSLTQDLDNAATYLAQVRACAERSPIKARITAVNEVEVSRSTSTNNPLYKVEVTFQALSGNNTGNPETLRSDWTYKFGFRSLANDLRALIGHDVLLHRYLEATGNPQQPTSKVLVYATPIGSANTGTTNTEPAQNGTETEPEPSVPQPAQITPNPEKNPDRETLAAITPTTSNEVVELAVQHLGMTAEQVIAEATAKLPPRDQGPRTPAQIASFWATLVHDHAA